MFLEQQYRSFAFYKGIEVTYTKIILCGLMNMTNMHFETMTGTLSGAMSAMFFVKSIFMSHYYFRLLS